MSQAEIVVPPATSIPRVDGWPVNLANLNDAIDKIISSARQRESFAVFTLNLDHLDKLRTLVTFRAAYETARYVTADGAPVARLASRKGARVERTTGADLIVPLVQRAASENIPVYLYGTSPDVLTAAERVLIQTMGSCLKIAGAESPPRGFDPASDDADAALDRIAASGAGLCFVALGAPKQEYLAARAVKRNIKVGFVCIGAGLDFIAGTQSRAPLFMQRYGIEWAWRLATNPRRLGVRYARCALVLVQILATLPLKQWRQKRST